MEQVFHFNNIREAQDFMGQQKDLPQVLESAFGVRLAMRDTWIQITGAADKVGRMMEFIGMLQQARSRGAFPGEQGLLSLIQAFHAGREHDLLQLYQCRLVVGRGKPPVIPRTFGQQAYIGAIHDNDICFGIGPAGTGKTYLAMAAALEALIGGKVSRIILTRPAIEAGETLGFLPGDMEQKVMPYLRPLYDALHDMMTPEDIERNIERGIIEMAPLAYMRGRTLNNAFVILDEAQNTTPEQMFMFLTRLGFDSRCVITGDLTQVDLPPHKSSGLLDAHNRLKGIPGIALQELGEADVVRHTLVQQVIQAYREGK